MGGGLFGCIDKCATIYAAEDICTAKNSALGRHLLTKTKNVINYFFVLLLVLSLTAGIGSKVCGIVSCILSIIVSG